MTYAEAVAKANAEKGPAVDIMWFEEAKTLRGKTVVGSKATMNIVEIVNGNVIMKVTDENYVTASVAWMLQNNGKRFQIK